MHDPQTNPTRALNELEGLNPRERRLEWWWRVVGQRLFRLTFHNWYRMRNRILRAFGAQVDATARVRPTVRITHPWNLLIGAHSTVGDHAILYCLGPVRIGRRCTVSQYAHLCAGSHDYTKTDMPLILSEIVIEDDAWIAADVFIGPGVTIGSDAVVGSRSTVLHDLPGGMVCAGDDAKALKQREIRQQAGASK